MNEKWGIGQYLAFAAIMAVIMAVTFGMKFLVLKLFGYEIPRSAMAPLSLFVLFFVVPTILYLLGDREAFQWMVGQATSSPPNAPHTQNSPGAKPNGSDDDARRDKSLTFLCEICIAAARRVGSVERGHIRLIRETLSRELPLTPRDLNALRGFLKSAINRPLSEVAMPLGARITELGIPRYSDKSQEFVEFVIGVATLGRSHIPEAARAFLREVGAEFGIARADLDRLIEQQLYNQERDPRADDLAILGLGAGATRDAIKAAYRALAKKWHPDLAGNTPEARRRFLQIQRAYEALMKFERAQAA